MSYAVSMVVVSLASGLDRCADAVLGTEVEHLLRLGDAPIWEPVSTLFPDDGEGSDRVGLIRQSDVDECTKG